jgi:EipB-like
MLDSPNFQKDPIAMIHSRMTRLIPLFSICTMVASSGTFAANLAAHRAYYTLEAKRVDKDSGLASVSGRLAYEIKGSDCDGYAVSYRIANRFIRGDGSDPQESDMRFSSFETGDGLSLDVQETQYVNAEPKTKARVKASRASVGDEANAELSGDETKSFKVAATALFPTVYQKRLVDLALAGTTRDDSVVYEGTDGDKAQHVISFIGAKKTGLVLDDSVDKSARDAFAKLAYWPVTMSYYAVDASGDAQPDYQASFNMFENGVSTDMVLDYGTYALTGKLNKLEVFKQESCK